MNKSLRNTIQDTNKKVKYLYCNQGSGESGSNIDIQGISPITIDNTNSNKPVISIQDNSFWKVNGNKDLPGGEVSAKYGIIMGTYGDGNTYSRYMEISHSGTGANPDVMYYKGQHIEQNTKRYVYTQKVTGDITPEGGREYHRRVFVLNDTDYILTEYKSIQEHLRDNIKIYSHHHTDESNRHIHTYLSNGSHYFGSAFEDEDVAVLDSNKWTSTDSIFMIDSIKLVLQYSTWDVITPEEKQEFHLQMVMDDLGRVGTRELQSRIKYTHYTALNNGVQIGSFAADTILVNCLSSNSNPWIDLSVDLNDAYTVIFANVPSQPGAINLAKIKSTTQTILILLKDGSMTSYAINEFFDAPIGKTMLVAKSSTGTEDMIMIEI